MYFCILLTVLLASSSVIGKPATTGPRVARDFNNTAAFTKIIPTNGLTIREAIYITPELLFVGKSNGDMVRCLYKDPSTYEMFYSYGSSYRVTAIVISGEYLYASLYNGVMLRCNLHEKNACTIFNSHSQINALAVASGYIHAGMQDGKILRCQLHIPNTCKTFNRFASQVTSLAATEKYIYAGLASKEIWRCSLSSESSCRLFSSGSSVESSFKGLSAKGDTTVGITEAGVFWNCTKNEPCLYKCVPSSGYSSMAVFDGSYYALDNPQIWKIKWFPDFNYTLYDKHEGASSISIAYRTYKMQDRYANEGKTCLMVHSRCPPYMTYYEINQRPMLEVFVKDGKLYNSRGMLVDTSEADIGSSGRAAIFAMGPDGQILLSNVHNTVLHISSLYAGNPVAGAGEMVVVNGVIKSIRACSDHYQPDTDLNQQVITALYMKGYTNKIDSLPCCSNNECGQINVEENTVVDAQQ